MFHKQVAKLAMAIKWPRVALVSRRKRFEYLHLTIVVRKRAAANTLVPTYTYRLIIQAGQCRKA